MATLPNDWLSGFDLTTCAATDLDSTLPPATLGVAVIHAPAADGDTVYLVVESRAGSLLAQCVRRLQTAKLPALEILRVSFKAVPPADSSAEALNAACRAQVILASELRRALRPALR